MNKLLLALITLLTLAASHAATTTVWSGEFYSDEYVRGKRHVAWQVLSCDGCEPSVPVIDGKYTFGITPANVETVRKSLEIKGICDMTGRRVSDMTPGAIYIVRQDEAVAKIRK